MLGVTVYSVRTLAKFLLAKGKIVLRRCCEALPAPAYFVHLDTAGLGTDSIGCMWCHSAETVRRCACAEPEIPALYQ